MNGIFADVIRSSVTNAMFMIFLFTLAQPKCGKKIAGIATICVLLINVASNMYFYQQQDYTTLAKLEVPMLLLGGLILRPLFQDSIMQWLFSFITAINVDFIVVFLSYVCCDQLPFPMYGNILLRFILFAVSIILFRRYLQTLYRQVVEHWHMFLGLASIILINFTYYIFSFDDIENNLLDQFVPLGLLVILAIFVYITIFYTLQIFSGEQALREENLKNQIQYELQRVSMEAIQSEVEVTENEYRSRLQNMEQVRRLRHDMNHHLSLITVLLRQNDTAGALDYITEISEEIPQKPLSNKNIITESFLGKYHELCKQSSISFVADITFDEDEMENKTHLGVILGNVLQNAYEAAQIAQEPDRYISVTGRQIHDNLLLVVKNGYCGVLNPGYKTTKTDLFHGFGLSSIKKAVEEYNGYIELEHDNSNFSLTVALTIYPTTS